MPPYYGCIHHYSKLSLYSKFNIISFEHIHLGLDNDVERGLIEDKLMEAIGKLLSRDGDTKSISMENSSRYDEDFPGEGSDSGGKDSKGFKHGREKYEQPKEYPLDEMNDNNTDIGNKVCSSNYLGTSSNIKNSLNIIFNPSTFPSDIIWRTDLVQPEFSHQQMQAVAKLLHDLIYLQSWEIKRWRRM